MLQLRHVRVLKRLIQVLHQILHVLNPNAETHEGVGDAKQRAILCTDGAMGHDGWDLDEGLDAAERLGQGDVLQLAQESVDVGQRALHPEREHSPEAFLLTLREFMLWVRREAGVNHLVDVPVLLEEAGDRHGV
ncbi:hypothetical protein BC938DRAFT_477925 [Jimgerdemannia flammicorona]|uniref:Uncharacterized protein n=1 Tax=Jimgerdemannia flammicorona TaxID=994334 RepID=A0A433QYP2_9FUNG|nr:hypothetical protein BC938DRAFT_477925 [Jimgerdemannia flammicorona]